MPWTPFILLLILFGIIYGNNFVDNRLHQFAIPYAAAVKNSDAQRVAILEGITDENLIYEKAKANEAQQNIQPPCHQLEDQDGNFQKRFLGLTDCLTNAERERNNLNRHIDFETNTGSPNTNSRTAIVALDSKSLYDINDDNIRTSYGNGNMNNEKSLLASIGLDNTYDFDLMHASLPMVSSSNNADFYEDLLIDTKTSDSKRNGAASTIGCDCKMKNDLLDLGQYHFPRYLLNAVCQSDDNSPDIQASRCWRGICKPLEYKVKVLTFRTTKDTVQKDPTLAWLPDDLRQLWKFKTVTVAAGCFCATG